MYFLGLDADKVKPNLMETNYGYDDENGDYQLVKGDHIAYRYEVMETLGTGSFG